MCCIDFSPVASRLVDWFDSMITCFRLKALSFPIRIDPPVNAPLSSMLSASLLRRSMLRCQLSIDPSLILDSVSSCWWGFFHFAMMLFSLLLPAKNTTIFSSSNQYNLPLLCRRLALDIVLDSILIACSCRPWYRYSSLLVLCLCCHWHTRRLLVLCRSWY